MLPRCCLIYISSIKLRHFLYLIYLGLGLFMSYLSDLFFIFIFMFIMINRKSREYRHTCSLANFLEHVLLLLDNNVDEKCE